jgi:hypothetical protein
MMPCKFCRIGSSSRGLEQIGKTRNHGTLFARRYRCQDCGAAMILSGNLAREASITEQWFPPGALKAKALERRKIRLRLRPRIQIVECILPLNGQAGLKGS